MEPVFCSNPFARPGHLETIGISVLIPRAVFDTEGWSEVGFVTMYVTDMGVSIVMGVPHYGWFAKLFNGKSYCSGCFGCPHFRKAPYESLSICSKVFRIEPGESSLNICRTSSDFDVRSVPALVRQFFCPVGFSFDPSPQCSESDST